MSAPRIVASIGVKDEVELIEATITHLRAIGVDLIIVRDLYSTDGTADVLAIFDSDADVWITQMSDASADADDRNLDLVRESGAEWAIFLDADEFPVPASGDLNDCASLTSADVLRIDRFNIPLRPAGPAMPDRLAPERYDDLLLVADPIPKFWAYIEQNPDTSWMRSRVAGRVMARPTRIAGLSLGGHGVLPAGSASLRPSTPHDLLIAHLPFTGMARFTRKVGNMRRVLSRHSEQFGETGARHWRRWVALADQGLLEEEFNRMIFDADTLAQLRRERIVRSAAEIFRERLDREATGSPGRYERTASSPRDPSRGA
jgi:hypothetical protein